MSPSITDSLRKVLVVEDDPMALLLVSNTLSQLDSEPEVVAATSVAAAIKALKTDQFDAALVDWRLPDGVGGKVLDFVVQHLNPPLPVIMMTAGDTEEAERALSHGAQDFLSKPKDIEKIAPVRRALRYALNRVRWSAERREEALRADAAERAEAMARLAAGVAHDLNNNLAVISMNLELLAGMLDPNDTEATESLETAREATRAAADRTTQLRIFTGSIKVESRPVDLSVVLTDALRARGSVPDLNCERLEQAAPTVRGDTDILRTVVDRLLDGAHELGRSVAPAISIDQPSLVAGTSWVLPPSPSSPVDLRVTFEWEGGEADVGTLRRRFEPFGEGAHGASLDLGECVGFVRVHGGALSARTHANGGAFDLWLPRWAPTQAPAEKPAPAPVEKGGTKVWVVDDEPLVRRVLVRLLSRRGMEVESFPDGLDAYMAARNGAHFDLLVTDLLMPGMGGSELVHRLREDGINQPVVVVTGYSDDIPTLSDLSGVSVLMKPFSNKALYEAIEERLAVETPR